MSTEYQLWCDSYKKFNLTKLTLESKVITWWAITAAKWTRDNEAELTNGRKDVFEDLERKKIELKTGIEYDFYESKNTDGKTICKWVTMSDYINFV